jgi:hypothetical protein
LPLFTSPTYHKKSLYEHLSSLPNNGIGTRVRQVKWSAKGIDQPFNVPFKGPVVIPQERKEENHLCYWEITRARIKISNGENNRKPHGKAWGRLTWRGEGRSLSSLHFFAIVTDECFIFQRSPLSLAAQVYQSHRKGRKSGFGVGSDILGTKLCEHKEQ